jgi:hypothetical protein
MRKRTFGFFFLLFSLLAGSLFAQKMTVKDSDSNVLMEVNDEGTVGSISLPQGSAPGTPTNKLYNVGGSLYWNGTALGTAGSAGGWTDGSTNVYTTTSTDKVGIGTSTPEFKLSLDDDGGILAKGTLESGVILSTSGEGTRLIWYPRKAAFRAGYVGDDSWNDANIGNQSAAIGVNTKASGEASMAMGKSTIASGSRSTAMGYASEASGSISTAMGDEALARGNYSTAIGTRAIADGQYAAAIGLYLKADSYVSTAIGQYNVGGGTAGSWVSADPLFEIGNGADNLSRANAMTVLKNGNVGVGVNDPDAKLEINGQLKVTGGAPGPGKVLTSDAAGLAAWETPSGGGGGWTDGGANVYTTTSTDKVGIGTSTPEFKLSLDNDGGILAKGTFGSGTALATSGDGTRLIWYPNKAAFRAGRAIGTDWDDANIGNYSVASGYTPKAKGAYSVAMGCSPRADGDYATAIGYSNHADGTCSVAMGESSRATGGVSTAIGSNAEAVGSTSLAFGLQTIANGDYSTAMGTYTTVGSYLDMAIGRYNVGGGTAGSWVLTDPIFEIGIGSISANANALTVLKNGKVGIGTSSPNATLAVHNTNTGNWNAMLDVLAPSAADDIHTAGITFGKARTRNQSGNLYFIPSATDQKGRISFGIYDFNDLVTIEGTGNVGIGDATPDYLLDMEADGVGGYYSASDHQWHGGSSRRLKQDIAPNRQDIFGILDDVDIVQYRFKTEVAENPDARYHVGFIAEDTPEILSGKDRNSMATGDCIGLLLAVVKEQQKEIETLKTEMKELRR